MRLRQLSRNTLLLLTANTGSAILSFFLSVLIGRILNEEGLGVYAVALAWTAPVRLLAEFGINTLILRDAAQNMTGNIDYIRLTTPVRLVLASVLTLLLWSSAPLLSENPTIITGIQISSALILIEPFYGAFTSLFRARQAMIPILWLNLGMLFMQVILTLVALMNGADITVILAINIVTSAGQLIAAWIVWRRFFYQPTSSALPDSLQKLLKRAYPFAIAAVLVALQMRSGTILLERLADTASVGYYAAAVRFVEAARMPPNALFGALFPLFSAHPNEARTLLLRVVFGVSAFSIVMGILFMLFGGVILQLTFGDQFLVMTPVLQAGIWSLLPSLLKGTFVLYAYALKKENVVNQMMALSLVIQILFSLSLIPLYGALGAMLAVIGGETVIVLLLSREIFFGQKYAR